MGDHPLTIFFKASSQVVSVFWLLAAWYFRDFLFFLKSVSNPQIYKQALKDSKRGWGAGQRIVRKIVSGAIPL